MKKITLLSILAFQFIYFFSGCNKKDMLVKKNDFVTYTIPAGEHRSTSSIKIHKENELNFKIKFDSTAIYTKLHLGNQNSINPLYGFSDCNSKHEINSARIGWRWFKNKLEIFAYCFVDSERTSELLTTIDIGKEYECNIKILDKYYHFSINNKACIIKRGCDNSTIKYFLYPYIGGSEPVSHDIKIRIKKL